jgi:hypothetical protein
MIFFLLSTSHDNTLPQQLMTTMQTIIIEDKKIMGECVVALTPHSLPLNKWKERKPHTYQEKNEGGEC